jgi:hypothetical protein
MPSVIGRASHLERSRCVPIEPALEFGNGNETQASAPDYAQLGKDRGEEERPRNSQCLGCLFWP